MDTTERPHDPSLAERVVACNNRGAAFLAAGDLASAEAAFREAAALAPAVPQIHHNLGLALARQGKLDDAVASVERALVLAPDVAETHRNLGLTLLARGEAARARASHERAVALAPASAEAHSNLVFVLDFDPAVTAAEAFAERRRWNDRHARSLARRRPHRNVPDPERRLRVGYVSADFHGHSAAAVTAPVVLNHDRARFEVVCYADVSVADAVTERFRAGVARWRVINGVSDAALAALVESDGIDVLVDLGGHSAANRLAAFARKPAPVQVTAWGHALGTGLDAVDYFFADPGTVPAGMRALFSETVVDLPSIVCWEPPADAPPVSAPPAAARGHVTFGSLNRLAKLSDPALALAADVLNAVPAACLLLKDPAFDQPSARARVGAAFATRGVDPARLDLRGASSQREHLAAYADVDLVLDPLPHGGGVTALEGLWMGVPMVTLRGERIPGRLGASFLETIGLPDLVAATPAEYVALAVARSRDVAALAALRAGLRGRVAASPLVDGVGYCRAVEAAYRDMWRRWCAGRRG
jgi:predicted O-linked N-acetylglucosamine transferase (SPINDLY family)